MKFIGQKYIIPTNLKAIAVIMYFHGHSLRPVRGVFAAVSALSCIRPGKGEGREGAYKRT